MQDWFVDRARTRGFIVGGELEAELLNAAERWAHEGTTMERAPRRTSLCAAICLGMLTGIGCSAPADAPSNSSEDALTRHRRSTVDSGTAADGGAPDTPPPPPSGLQIGVNVHTGGGSTTANGQVASVMANRNLRVARLDYFVNSDQTLVRDQIVKINANGGSAQLVVENSYQWDGSCNSNLAAVEQDSYNQTSQMVGTMKDIAHDFEVLNEVQLHPWINNEVPWNSAGTSTAPYAGKPCVASVTAAIRGATRAIHDHGQRAIVGVIGRDFGWLSWLRQNSVAWDVTGYHIYPHYGDPSLASDPWFGTNGPLYQLALFGKPITINEFNCGEIYDSNYENTAGQPDTETCLKSVNKHLQEIRSYSGGQPIGSVVTYELLDEPSKAAPENRFGLMYALSTPKIELYLVTAFAGGTLTSTEQATITSRGLLTDAQIAAMR